MYTTVIHEPKGNKIRGWYSSPEQAQAAMALMVEELKLEQSPSDWRSVRSRFGTSDNMVTTVRLLSDDLLRRALDMQLDDEACPIVILDKTYSTSAALKALDSEAYASALEKLRKYWIDNEYAMTAPDDVIYVDEACIGYYLQD